MGGVVAAPGCDCSAAGSRPDESSPVVFHGRMRGDATMKIVPLIPLCLVSSSHNSLNSILPLSIKAPVVPRIVRLCSVLKTEDKARRDNAAAFCLRLSFLSFPFAFLKSCCGSGNTPCGHEGLLQGHRSSSQSHRPPTCSLLCVYLKSL